MDLDIKDAQARLNEQWDKRPYRVVDWVEYEMFVRDVIESKEIPDAIKLVFLAEALGAFTRRGIPKTPTK